MTIWEKIDSIEDAVLAILQAGSLSEQGIAIVRGLADGQDQSPFIRVLFEPTEVDDRSFAGREEWFLRFMLMAQYDSYAQEDPKGARMLALNASREIQLDRTLGGTVSDTVRVRYHPEFRRELESEKLFGAAVEHVARFCFREV